MGRVVLFNRGRAGKAAQRAKWLLSRPTVVSKVLTLPGKENIRQGKKKMTIDVAGWLLNCDDLLQITAVSSKRRSVDCVEQQVNESVV